MPRAKKTEEHDNEARLHGVGRNVLTFLAILGIILLLWLIWRLKSVVVLVVISVVFATGLAPAVARLQKVRITKTRLMPRSLAILVIYVAALIIALGAATLIIVPVVKEAVQFAADWPKYLAKVNEWLAGLQEKYPRLPDLPEIINRAQSQFGSVGKYAVGSVGAVFGFFGGVVSVISVAVITFYLLSTYENVRRAFLSIIPPKHEDKAGRTLSLMAAAMGGWLRGQLTLAAIIGLSSATAMLAFQVPYAAVIGVVGAIGELVPMIGPIAAAVPAVLITLVAGSTAQLIGVIVFFVILAQVENTFLTPRIMGKSVGLTPLLTLVALLSGAALLGIVGALLAIPAAAALQVLFREVIAPAIRNWEHREDAER